MPMTTTPAEAEGPRLVRRRRAVEEVEEGEEVEEVEEVEEEVEESERTRPRGRILVADRLPGIPSRAAPAVPLDVGVAHVPTPVLEGATAVGEVDATIPAGNDSRDDGESPAECWICRDSSSPEPLVHPCQCRGSMAGIHASCVEAWVACHRRAARHELPHCPVCRAPYGGSERRPGARTLARHLGAEFMQHLTALVVEFLRFAVLGVLLVQYSSAAASTSNQEEHDEATAAVGRSFRLRGPWHMQGGGATVEFPLLAVLALALLLLHKLAVLAVSVPPWRGPPAGRVARLFFSQDLWSVARHAAELLAAALLLGAQCARRTLPLSYFAPVCLVALAPVAQLLLWYPVSVCFKEVTLFLSFLGCMPVLALFELGRLAWRHRQRLLNPLDGALHVVVSLAAVILLLACRSHRPACMLFAIHAVFLAMGLLERGAVRRLPWQEGPAWWCAVLIAVEATSVAHGPGWFTLLLLLAGLRSLRRSAARLRPQALFHGSLWWCTLLVVAEAINLALHEARSGQEPVLGTMAGGTQVHSETASLAWLLLLGSLACTVNWRRCARQYNHWQKRHSTFVLCSPPLPLASGGGGNGTTGGVQERCVALAGTADVVGPAAARAPSRGLGRGGGAGANGAGGLREGVGALVVAV